MIHYGPEILIDYLRGLTEATQTGAIRIHVADCPRCRQRLDWLERAWRAAASEAGVPAVPDELVARAKALFNRPPQERGWIEKLREVTGVLVGRSEPDLLPAGVRGTALEGQLQYQAGPYLVDLILESGPRPEIIGQLVNPASPAERMGGAVVELLAGRRTVGATETNQFGEFILDRPAGRDLALQIALREAGTRIVIPLRARPGKWRSKS